MIYFEQLKDDFDLLDRAMALTGETVKSLSKPPEIKPHNSLSNQTEPALFQHGRDLTTQADSSTLVNKFTQTKTKTQIKNTKGVPPATIMDLDTEPTNESPASSKDEAIVPLPVKRKRISSGGSNPKPKTSTSSAVQ